MKYLITFAVICCVISTTFAQLPRLSSKSEFKALERENHIKDSLADTFELLSLYRSDGRNSGMKVKVERIIIPEGDSTRIKWVWDNPKTQIFIDGISPTPEEVKKGEFIVTIWPKKTRWVPRWWITASGDKIEVGSRVIVVPRDKYKAIIERESKLAKSDYSKLSKFLDSLAGGTYKDFATGRKK